jgi:hypothetical protein
MRNKDVIEIFQLISEQALVYISEQALENEPLNFQ